MSATIRNFVIAASIIVYKTYVTHRQLTAMLSNHEFAVRAPFEMYQGCHDATNSKYKWQAEHFILSIRRVTRASIECLKFSRTFRYSDVVPLLKPESMKPLADLNSWGKIDSNDAEIVLDLK